MESHLECAMNLPEEILMEILGFLKLKDLKSVLLSSLIFSKIILQTEFMKDRVLDFHPKFYISSSQSEDRPNWSTIFSRLTEMRKYYTKHTETKKSQIPKKAMFMRSMNQVSDEKCEKVTVVFRTNTISYLHLIYSQKKKQMFFVFCDRIDKEKGYEDVGKKSFFYKEGVFVSEEGCELLYAGEFFWKGDEVADFHFRRVDYSVWYPRGAGGDDQNLDLWLRDVKVSYDDGEVQFTKEMVKELFKETVDKSNYTINHTKKRKGVEICCKREGKTEFENLTQYLESIPDNSTKKYFLKERSSQVVNIKKEGQILMLSPGASKPFCSEEEQVEELKKRKDETAAKNEEVKRLRFLRHVFGWEKESFFTFGYFLLFRLENKCIGSIPKLLFFLEI